MSTFLITILMCFEVVTVSGEEAFGLWIMCAFADIAWALLLMTLGAYIERK